MTMKLEVTEKECLVSLRRHWGYTCMREHQYSIVSAILSGKDVFVLMATGSGKSLSYQLPPVLLRERGIKAWSLVICPLISLAEDQVAILNSMGISAVLIGGSNSGIRDQENKLFGGDYCVVYLTPEKLISWKSSLSELANRFPLACIAVDEAHCVSEWGHDFRPSYRRLKDIRSMNFQNTPMLALTATATPKVVADIASELCLCSPLEFKTTFNRPNLHYTVKTRLSDRDVIIFLKKYYAKSAPTFSASGSPNYIASALVYVNTQADAEKVAAQLRDAIDNVAVQHYHAGMPLSKRTEVHKAFCDDKINIIVATIAFGMGINKPDVRLVIHCEMPHSVEAYYQQTGRAGRDGYPSKCILFYGRNDIVKLHSIKSFKSGLQNGCNDKLEAMKNYCSSNSKTIRCRRKYLLNYFCDSFTPEVPIDCCDLCDAEARKADPATEGWISTNVDSTQEVDNNASIDFSHEILLFLRALRESGQYFGLGTVVGILCGSKDKSLMKIRGFPHRLKTFGRGRRHTRAWWTELGHALVEEGLVCNQVERGGGGSFSYLRCMLSSSGTAYLNQNEKVETAVLLHTECNSQASTRLPIPRSIEMTRSFRIQTKLSPPFSQALLKRRDKEKGHDSISKCASRATTSGVKHERDAINETSKANRSDIYDDEICNQLEGRLRSLRAKLGESLNLRPYNILSTHDIKNLVRFRPIMKKDLQHVPGWGLHRIENFGQQFTDCICTFMKEMGLPVASNVILTNESDDSKDASHQYRLESANNQSVSNLGHESSLAEHTDPSKWTVRNPFRHCGAKVQDNGNQQDEYCDAEVQHDTSKQDSQCDATIQHTESKATSLEDRNVEDCCDEKTERNCTNANGLLPERVYSFGPLKVAVSKSTEGGDENMQQPDKREPNKSSSHEKHNHPQIPTSSCSKRKRIMSGPSITVNKSKSTTRLRRTSSEPKDNSETEPRGVCQSLENLPPTTPNLLEDCILEYLYKNPKQSFCNILNGILGSASCCCKNEHLQKYSPLVRRAIENLSNDFCIYIDGDKYCAL